MHFFLFSMFIFPSLFFFFFKQKTAYEIHSSLEFRRVLFRSPEGFACVSKQAANEKPANPSGTSQGQIVLRLLSRLLRLELARGPRERCSVRVLRPNTQPCLARLTPYLFDVLGTGRRLGSLRKDFAARASAAGFRSALRGSRVRAAIEASLHPLPVLCTQPPRERAAEPALLHLQLHQRNPRQRLAVDALRREAAVVDPRLDVRLAKRLVGERRPALG